MNGDDATDARARRALLVFAMVWLVGVLFLSMGVVVAQENTNVTNSNLEAQAVAQGTTVYVGSHDDSLYALDADTGDKIWRFTKPSGSVGSSPTVVDGTVYVTGGGSLYAIDAETGSEVWNFTKSLGSVGASPTVVDGTVYIGGTFEDGGALYAVDANTGNEIWDFTEPSDSVASSPTVVDGTVYFGSHDTNLYAVNSETGNKVWEFSEPNGVIRSSPTVYDSSLYVGSQDKKIYAVDTTTGKQKWNFTEPDGGITSSPTVSGSVLYVGSGSEKYTDGTLYAIDIKNGQKIWEFKANKPRMQSSPTVSDGLVYVGTGQSSDTIPTTGGVYAIHAENGSKKWFYETSQTVSTSSPTVYNNRVYFGSQANEVISVDADTGNEVWVFSVPCCLSGVHSSPTVVTDPEMGDSIGSRVNLGTLGHHHVWAEKASNGSGGDAPSITDSSFKIDPYPVEKGGTPEVSVNVKNADDVDIEVNGEKKDMQNTAGNTWTREISSSVNDKRGKRVNLEITAGDDTLSDVTDAYPRTQLPADPGTVPPTEQIHYYIFDDVEDVPVVLAKFQNQDPADFGFGDAENVTQWERAREYDVNTYMGSGRGSSGSIGFNLVYYDNGTDFYTVGPDGEYTDSNVDAETRNFACDFPTDAASAASLNADKFVATHPGRAPINTNDVTAFAVPGGILTNSCGAINNARIYQDMGSDNTNSFAQYGIWLEELSHLYLGMGDLYSGGDIKGGIVNEAGDPKTGLMASGINNQGIIRNRIPQPYSVLSQTRLNDLGFANSEDLDWPWANRDVKIVEPVNPTTVEARDATDIGIGDDVPVVDTGAPGSNTVGTVKYLFESQIDGSGVRGYKIVSRRTFGGQLGGMKRAVLISKDVDGERSLVSGSVGAYVDIEVDSVAEPAEVTVEYDSGQNSNLASITPSINITTTTLNARNVTSPDVDLRAVDSQGRVTGINKNGKFVNEIPGANASGDTGGVEWISVPDDADVEFEVSSDDVQKFIDETNVSEENVTVTYSTSVTGYGSNTNVEQEDGEPTVTNTTTKMVTENESIDPGQTESAVNETVIAGFSRSPREASPGEKVRFNASISTNLDGTIQTYEWDLDNDGQTEATGLTANRSYNTTGNYTVELTVTGDNGETDTTNLTVNVVGVFSQPLIDRFQAPPQDTDQLHPTLYEDLDGDGDGTDVSPTVAVFGELIRGNNLGLTDKQARKLNWNQGSPETEVTPADMVSLFGEKIRAD